MVSLDSWFMGLPDRFDAAAAGDLSAVFYFAIGGAGGGDYTVRVAEGKCEVTKAKPENPDLIATVTDTDMAAIAAGELDPVSAFMAGKLQVDGDLALAMRLPDLFLRR